MKKKLSNIITWIIVIGLIIFTYNIIREKTIDVIGTKVKILDDVQSSGTMYKYYKYKEKLRRLRKG